MYNNNKLDNFKVRTFLEIYPYQIFNNKKIQYFDNLDNEDLNIYNLVLQNKVNTHPHFVYNKYNTNIGWPSVQDYLVLLDFEKMKGHFVISVEGIWIIFFTDEYIRQKNKINKYKLKEYVQQYLSLKE